MKRHRLYLSILMASILSIWPQTAPAIQDQLKASDPDFLRKYTEAKNQKNFAGWRSVLFYCWGRKELDRSLNAICERSFINARFLAATAKVNFEKARSMQHVGFEAGVGERLILLLDLQTTQGGGPPTVITANLRAYTTYSGPIRTIDDSQEQPKERFQTRSGDLIFWERGSIAVGSNGTDLEHPLSDAIELLLKEFFSEYLSAQR